VIGQQTKLADCLYRLATLALAEQAFARARELGERALALSQKAGEAALEAAVLCLLAQLEVVEGNFLAAREMAQQATDLLAAAGDPNVEEARKLLQMITVAASGDAEAVQQLGDEMRATLARVDALPPEQRLTAVEAELEAARRRNDARQTVLWLMAQCSVYWQLDDAEGCEESFRQAEQAADAAPEPEPARLRALIDLLRQERSEAEVKRDPQSTRLVQAGFEKYQTRAYRAALGDFEAALRAAVQEKDPLSQAQCLLMIGYALLHVGRPQEAVARLGEGQKLAAGLGKHDLLEQLREVQGQAAQALALERTIGCTLEEAEAGLQRPLEEALAGAGTAEAQARTLLARSAGLAAREPEQALELADAALPLTQQSGVKELEIGAGHFKSCLLANQGRLDEARDGLRQALAVAKQEKLADWATTLAAALATLEQHSSR
jgi:hypothetical protein